MRQIAPGGNVVGKTGQNEHKQRLRGRKVSTWSLQQYIYTLRIIIYYIIYISTYIPAPSNAYNYILYMLLLHYLMPGNAAFRSTVCMHVWVSWHFTQTHSLSHFVGMH